MAYQIPDRVINGFAILLKSSQKQINLLINILSGIKNYLLPQQISEYLINKNIYSEKESFEITKVLLSLYRLKEKENKSIEEIIDNIEAALIETNEKELIPNKKFKENLSKLLKIKTIGIISKAMNLSSEYDKLFIEARILTDIRPVFYENIENKIETGIIIHNLRIEYHKGEEIHKEIYLTLDSSDLKKLKETIIRAEEKEKLLKSNLKESFYFINTSID